MIHGRYGNTTGRPYIEGHLTIPFLNVEGLVSFLVDTGSDGTVLMPLDVVRLKVDYSRLTTTDESIGIGGRSTVYVVPAILMIPEEARIAHIYEFELRVAERRPELEKTPSLIGRDILRHWRLTFDWTRSRLSAEILHSDKQFPLS
jgi:hypothetical protein